MKFAWCLTLCLTTLFACGCRRKDVRRVVIDVPEMKGDACAAIVVAAVKRLPGVEFEGVTTDVSAHRVTVVYDSLQIARKNIEFAISDAGFRTVEVVVWPGSGLHTNVIPAHVKARESLPPECR